ncbi:hypothetical protein [Actinoplanes sp. L3-i22]|uniref:hypothetical protein n=1 Tax=Actinoplanes sp. L3-i22 TaxID=2836373 RepID=UPI001C761CFE|nr:hypothetical protein [Actinoplanes sp. L3-i22]BCY09109.1 hypothetical protein L3i22_041970 [Actinoplanes sp. L3-i22]
MIEIDLMFVSFVAALLLDSVPEPPGWPGRTTLRQLVRARFSGDQAALLALAGMGAAGAGPGRVEALARAVHRYAEQDPAFRDDLRRLVVDAYTDPITAAGLPDPSPPL